MLGAVAYGASGALYLVSGLVVPFPWLVGLWVVWLAGLVGVAVLALRRPVWSLVGLPAAVAFWYLYVSVGEWLLGWTA